MKLRLPDVTLCAADSVTTALTARALRQSVGRCEFADAILFSDLPLEDPAFRTISIPKLGSRGDYSRFVLKELAGFIATTHVLMIQWDGYVLEPAAWKAHFQEYDLIGARWSWHQDGLTVGNGGFSLRSRRLLDAMAGSAFPFIDDLNEDEQICRCYRRRLEQECGLRFAPEHVADAFAYERSLPHAPTFGFHGLFNVWRHVDDHEMAALAAALPRHVLQSVEFVELICTYVSLRKFAPLSALYARWQQLLGSEQIRAQLQKFIQNPQSIEHVLQVCDSTVK